MKNIILICALVVACCVVPSASAGYFQGFETDVSGWDIFGGAYNARRVASGTNSITSASGSFHAEASATASEFPAGNWGGYDSATPEYATRVDIYLDTGLATNDLRFDFTSAINNPAGDHLRDFAFNAGFYNDLAGADGFVVSASNTTGRGNSYPKNPGRDPVEITTTGWYTFEHRFYDDGSGVLAVDLSIYDSADALVKMWTLSNPLDIIATAVGGNRYGWFPNNELSVLAFDNTELDSGAPVPEPISMIFFGTGIIGVVGFISRKKMRKAA